MEIWLLAFIGGLVGSVMMDFTEYQMSKLGVSSGVNAAYIGRWVKGLLGGVFIHRDISTSQAVKHEARIGQAFHFIIGGGVVALFYPIFYDLLASGLGSSHLLLATLYGSLTSVLPWLVLMPSFGWGLFGLKSPVKSNTIISPIISHLPYGLGIGLTIVLVNRLMA